MTSTRLLLTLTATTMSLFACSTGGSEDRDLSEIKIAASHHMFGLGGTRSIPKFPIPRTSIGTDLGIFTMSEASEYSITRTTVTSAPEGYSLTAEGELFLVVPVPRSAPTRFIGAYREAVHDKVNPSNNQAGAFFFTDRFAPTSSPSVGTFIGTDAVDDKIPDPAGDYHMFSQHVIFSKKTLPDENEVGRSVEGSLTIAAGLEGAPRAITGTGNESSGANIDFTGSATGAADRRINITKLDYRIGAISDARTFTCGESLDVILGVDTQDTGGAAGFIALVRKFTTAIVDQAAGRKALAGTYYFGMHTIFVRTGASGIDAANGTIEFTDAGGWTLTGVGSAGNNAGKFEYQGTYVFSSDGGGKFTNRMVLTVKGPPAETWTAAVDKSFGTVVIVDNDLEDRRPRLDSTELNFMIATRKLDPK